MPRGILKSKTHIFVDADPVVYRVRAVHADNGKPRYVEIAELTGLSYSTVKNLLGGKTKRPHHYTVLRVMEFGFGYRETWHKAGAAYITVHAKERKK